MSTYSNVPRSNSCAVRSPNDNFFALIAPTRSSSILCGKTDAIINPPVEITPEASISADVPFNSVKTSACYINGVVKQLESNKLAAKKITLKLKYSDFQTITRTIAAR